MRRVELSWLGPFTLKQIVSRENLPIEFQGQGVYVWINKRHDRIAYVGKASSVSLWKRQFDWYWSGISGQSLIPSGTPGKPEWIPDRTKVAETITDEDRYVDLVRKAFRYMPNYEVYVAGVKETDVISRLEQLLLFSLQPDDTKFPGAEPESEIAIDQIGAPWSLSKFGSQVRPLSNKPMQATCEDARA